MSFGVSISGVKDWTTIDNYAQEGAKFAGGPFVSSLSSLLLRSHPFHRLLDVAVQGPRCHGLGGTVVPTVAIIDPFKTANVTLGDQANCFVRESRFSLSARLSLPLADPQRFTIIPILRGDPPM